MFPAPAMSKGAVPLPPQPWTEVKTLSRKSGVFFLFFTISSARIANTDFQKRIFWDRRKEKSPGDETHIFYTQKNCFFQTAYRVQLFFALTESYFYCMV